MRRLQSYLFLGMMLGACGLPTQASDTLAVFVSVPPLETFVKKVGGERVSAESLVRAGANPHTYEPTPTQIARLASARLFVAVGLPFEEAWKARILAASPDVRYLDARDGIQLRPMAGHHHDDEGEADVQAHRDHDHEDEGEELDPHIWTSPLLAKEIAARIATSLSELDPVHKDDYDRNLAAFQAELNALDGDIRGTLKGLRSRKFMVYHPAWGYFAATYGLTQVPIEKMGKEPGPKTMAALIDQARHEHVKAIFIQPQFPRTAAEQVARAIGGRVEVIDNLTTDYIPNLRHIANVIADADR